VFKVTKRIYRTDEDGSRELLHAPGTTISDADAEAAGLLDEDATEEEPSAGAPFSSLAAGATLTIGGRSGPKRTVRGRRQAGRPARAAAHPLARSRRVCLRDRSFVLPAPTAPLGTMKLAELGAVCADEGIDPDGANTRGDYILVICRTRGQRRANDLNER
jgi:hypothetical protein